MLPFSVCSRVLAISSLDHRGLSVIAQCSAMFPPSRDLQEADARLDPADGAHTVVSHCILHSLLPV